MWHIPCMPLCRRVCNGQGIYLFSCRPRRVLDFGLHLHLTMRPLHRLCNWICVDGVVVNVMASTVHCFDTVLCKKCYEKEWKSLNYADVKSYCVQNCAARSLFLRRWIACVTVRMCENWNHIVLKIMCWIYASSGLLVQFWGWGDSEFFCAWRL